MKKIMKKLGIVVLSLSIILGSLALGQKENIKAIINSQKYTKEEIMNNNETKKAEFHEKLKLEIENPIRDFTKEEIDLIQAGKATPEEILEIIKKEAGIETVKETEIETEIETKPTTPPKDAVTSNKTKEEVVNNALGELYALKANMNGQLRGLMETAKAEYLALPQEKRGNQAKSSIVQKYISQGSSLEGSSNQTVNNILNNLKSELELIGEDTSVVGTMRSAYENEKSAQKSFYLSFTS